MTSTLAALAALPLTPVYRPVLQDRETARWLVTDADGGSLEVRSFSWPVKNMPMEGGTRAVAPLAYDHELTQPLPLGAVRQIVAGTDAPELLYEPGRRLFEIGVIQPLGPNEAPVVRLLREASWEEVNVLHDGTHAVTDGAAWVGGTARLIAGHGARVIAHGQAVVTAVHDAVVDAFDQTTVHASDTTTVRAVDRVVVIARDEASVDAGGQATVTASGHASVTTRDAAMCVAREQCIVHGYHSSRILASDACMVDVGNDVNLVARDRVRVRAHQNATVDAADEVTVTETYDSVRVRAAGRATVYAGGIGRVAAYDEATVMLTDDARGDFHDDVKATLTLRSQGHAHDRVRASGFGSSMTWARDSAHVTLAGNAWAEIRGAATGEAGERATLVLREHAVAKATDDVQAGAHGHSMLALRGRAWGRFYEEAYGEAHDQARAFAHAAARVDAHDDSHLEVMQDGSGRAFDRAKVELHGNGLVEPMPGFAGTVYPGYGYGHVELRAINGRLLQLDQRVIAAEVAGWEYGPATAGPQGPIAAPDATTPDEPTVTPRLRVVAAETAEPVCATPRVMQLDPDALKCPPEAWADEVARLAGD